MGQPHRGPDYALADRLTALEKTVRALCTANPLQNAQIGRGGLLVNGSGGITLEGGGSLTLNGGGNLNVTGGNIDLSHGNMDVTGNGSINVTGTGQVAVDGLALSAVRAAGATNSGTNFTLGIPANQIAQVTIPVPAGFTTAIVSLNAAAGAFLSGSAQDYFYLGGGVTVPSYTTINWLAPAVLCQGDSGTVAGATWYPSQSYAWQGTFTGVPSGSITAWISVRTQSNTWAAQTSNEGYVNAQVTFLA